MTLGTPALLDSPYNIVESSKGILNPEGKGNFVFYNPVNGTQYYVFVRHRNSMETWKAQGISFNSDSLSYDFTSSSSQAYGNNLILKGSKYCIYSARCQSNGIVDASDLSMVDSDALIQFLDM